MGRLRSTIKALDNALDMTRKARMARADAMFPHSGYHGTDADIPAFDLSRGGHSTGANSAKQGVWIVDNPRVAGGYADHAASDAKIHRILQQANEAERQGDWDTYERLIIKAEDLEQSWRQGGPDARNLGQNVMPLRYGGNFYEYDAGGEAYFALEDQVNDIIRRARKEGYDGVRFKNLDDAAGYANMPANHTVVFDPANIRSVNAAFDPAKSDSPNLLAGGAAAAVGLGAATQGEDAAAYAPDPVLSGLSAGTTAYMQEAEQRKGRWDDLREDLLNAVDQGLQAIDMPWRGYLGLSRLAGGLVAGEGFDQALNAGAMQARQPLEQTAYELGGEVTDATGSPALGTAVNVGVNIGGPI